MQNNQPTADEMNDYLIGYGKADYGVVNPAYYARPVGPNILSFYLNSGLEYCVVLFYSNCVMLDKGVFDGRKNKKFHYYNYGSTRSLMSDVIEYAQGASKYRKKDFAKHTYSLDLAKALVGVQPMTGPNGKIFHLEYTDGCSGKILAEF